MFTKSHEPLNCKYKNFLKKFKDLDNPRNLFVVLKFFLTELKMIHVSKCSKNYQQRSKFRKNVTQ